MSITEHDEMPLELDIPDGIADADQAMELIRAWIADGSLVVSLNADAFGDQLSEWGRLLAQIGRHVAYATALQGDMSEEEAMAAIRSGFEALHPVPEMTLSGKVRSRLTH